MWILLAIILVTLGTGLIFTIPIFGGFCFVGAYYSALRSANSRNDQAIFMAVLGWLAVAGFITAFFTGVGFETSGMH
jgi:hypothetical protein